MSENIKDSFFLLRVWEKMSIVALIWCEQLQKLRNRNSQKEEQRQGVPSTEQPAALTSQFTTHPLELLVGVQNNTNSFVAAQFERWFSQSVSSPSSSAIYNMMDCICP